MRHTSLQSLSHSLCRATWPVHHRHNRDPFSFWTSLPNNFQLVLETNSGDEPPSVTNHFSHALGILVGRAQICKGLHDQHLCPRVQTPFALFPGKGLSVLSSHPPTVLVPTSNWPSRGVIYPKTRTICTNMCACGPNLALGSFCRRCVEQIFTILFAPTEVSDNRCGPARKIVCMTHVRITPTQQPLARHISTFFLRRTFPNSCGRHVLHFLCPRLHHILNVQSSSDRNLSELTGKCCDSVLFFGRSWQFRPNRSPCLCLFLFYTWVTMLLRMTFSFLLGLDAYVSERVDSRESTNLTLLSFSRSHSLDDLPCARQAILSCWPQRLSWFPTHAVNSSNQPDAYQSQNLGMAPSSSRRPKRIESKLHTCHTCNRLYSNDSLQEISWLILAAWNTSCLTIRDYVELFFTPNKDAVHHYCSCLFSIRFRIWIWYINFPMSSVKTDVSFLRVARVLTFYRLPLGIGDPFQDFI